MQMANNYFKSCCIIPSHQGNINFIKIKEKHLFFMMDNTKNVKGQFTKWEEMFINYIDDLGFISNMNNNS